MSEDSPKENAQEGSEDPLTKLIVSGEAELELRAAAPENQRLIAEIREGDHLDPQALRQPVTI